MFYGFLVPGRAVRFSSKVEEIVLSIRNSPSFLRDLNEEMRWKLAELLDELAKMVSALDEIVRYLSLHAMQAEFIDVKKPLEQKIFNFDNH